MLTVDILLQRALSMVGRNTVYWPGHGGHVGGARSAAEPLAVGAEWPRLDAMQRAELLPIAQAAGLDVLDPNLEVMACDCSGFVCWALGMPRRVAPDAFTTPDGWIHTDSIHADALGSGQLFQAREHAAPGCIVVYPKPPDKAFGHIGIVTAADVAGKATRVVHCGAENFKTAPFDAIKNNAPTAFELQPGSVYAWCRDVAPA
jgi:hypothetical protein